MAKTNVYEEYVEKGAAVADLGRKIERAQAQIRKAQDQINEIHDQYTQAREDLTKLVDDWGQDPLNLVAIGQSPAVQRAREVAGNGSGGGGRGKNQSAILDVLAGSSDGLTQAQIVTKVKEALGGGSDPSIVQATSALYKQQAIRRTGKRGSFRYHSLDNPTEATTIKPGEELSSAQQKRLAEVSA